MIRGIFTWLMIGLFCVIIYLGPLALMVTVRVHKLCQNFSQVSDAFPIFCNLCRPWWFKLNVLRKLLILGIPCIEYTICPGSALCHGTFSSPPITFFTERVWSTTLAFS